MLRLEGLRGSAFLVALLAEHHVVLPEGLLLEELLHTPASPRRKNEYSQIVLLSIFKTLSLDLMQTPRFEIE